MTLDDLRNLDPKDAGNWPIQVQLGSLIVVLVLTIAAGYFYVWSAQVEELDAGQATEVQLKTEFIDKKKRAINLAEYKQQLLEIQQSFGALLKQLPNRSEMETLLTEINQAGVGRGLLFELFKPGLEIKTAEFVEAPISIKVTGSYHDLAAFVSDIAQLSRIVILSDIKLSTSKDQLLTMEATIKTYRALDEAELQAIRQAEAEARKKKK
ncbi:MULTISPECIES: type 4a pilus biogenesis protein PilO [Deefgea]|uniref:Type 4a pilus biogenesis protein PilO n=1 Tax=Deefgea piscis TaxID=2739061 RepID=A0A6M8SRG5_9NEIS|nr:MULTISPECIES: type 4a pilus biogenesis protein PilO [Deefgea]MBM5574720.1 type 4a pilus biogenesis protein PilO [Deefgea sp. CFH1-16]QKJ66698.1 type 4a pilus biogenesis protein PilO [Deefgea piscis]